MRILNFADLHITSKNCESYKRFKEVIDKLNYDVIVIAGDVTDNRSINPFEMLSKLTSKPIIFCLGNHEFAYRSVEETLQEYYKMKNYSKNYANVYCLDVCGHVDIENVRFVGNVLWYDGSMKDIYSQSEDFILPSWLDSKIQYFNFKNENAKCIKQIKNNYSKGKVNYLITHCVPDITLNRHSEKPGYYNMYSGVKHLLNDFEQEGIHFEFAVCGHTHRYATNEINGTHCVNIGNDYEFTSGELKYFIFEIN